MRRGRFATIAVAGSSHEGKPDGLLGAGGKYTERTSGVTLTCMTDVQRNLSTSPSGEVAFADATRHGGYSWRLTRSEGNRKDSGSVRVRAAHTLWNSSHPSRCGRGGAGMP